MKNTFKKIEQSCLTFEELKKLSNKEIAAILMQTVWADFDLFSPESDLIDEVIRRLINQKGENSESTRSE